MAELFHCTAYYPELWPEEGWKGYKHHEGMRNQFGSHGGIAWHLWNLSRLDRRNLFLFA